MTFFLLYSFGKNNAKMTTKMQMQFSYNASLGYMDNNVIQYLLMLSQSIHYDVLNSFSHGTQSLKFGSQMKL